MHITAGHRSGRGEGELGHYEKAIQTKSSTNRLSQHKGVSANLIHGQASLNTGGSTCLYVQCTIKHYHAMVL